MSLYTDNGKRGMGAHDHRRGGGGEERKRSRRAMKGRGGVSIRCKPSIIALRATAGAKLVFLARGEPGRYVYLGRP